MNFRHDFAEMARDELTNYGINVSKDWSDDSVSLQFFQIKRRHFNSNIPYYVLYSQELLDKFPYEVSGGQKQRAAVARALITNPKLILADEPTGALDSKAASALLSVFGEINAEGQTILMVTHSAQAASHASRVLFIKDGEVFHQIYKGSKSRQEMYQMIADTLTILTTGGEQHA